MIQSSVLFIPLLALLVGSHRISALLLNSNLSFEAVRNISCVWASSHSLDSNFITTIGWTNATLNPYYDFCAIRQINSTLRNGSIMFAVHLTPIRGYNVFMQYISNRCLPGQFQLSNTPIGYGSCTQLPYERYTTKICICSTDNCNLHYSFCEASVQATRAGPLPPNLPAYHSPLTNYISCHQRFSGPSLSFLNNYSAHVELDYFPVNVSEYYAYASTHAVACSFELEQQTGDQVQGALIDEDYSTSIYNILLVKYHNPTNILNQTPTSIAIDVSSGPRTNTSLHPNGTTSAHRLCICSINYCNQDLATCMSGLSGIGPTTTPASTTKSSTSTAGTTGASANSSTTAPPTTSSKGKCFPGTTRVRRDDGTVLMMRDVRVGDRLLVADGTYSPVLIFLVREQQRSAINYLQISTNASTLEITPSHLILMHHQGDTSPPRYLQASRLRPGDHIFSLSSDSNEVIGKTQVIEAIRDIQRNDAYAPVTESGTLVVNDIHVSCYAKYEYHSLIHAAMYPLRIYNKIKHYSFGSHTQSNGLHTYVELWLHASRFLDLLIRTV